MELTALIQKTPNGYSPAWNVTSLGISISRRNEHQNVETSLGGKSQATQGILAPREILFIKQRAGVKRIQVHYVSKETEGEADSWLLPRYKQRKIIFFISHLYSIQPL